MANAKLSDASGDFFVRLCRNNVAQVGRVHKPLTGQNSGSWAVVLAPGFTQSSYMRENNNKRGLSGEAARKRKRPAMTGRPLVFPDNPAKRWLELEAQLCSELKLAWIEGCRGLAVVGAAAGPLLKGVDIAEET